MLVFWGVTIHHKNQNPPSRYKDVIDTTPFILMSTIAILIPTSTVRSGGAKYRKSRAKLFPRKIFTYLGKGKNIPVDIPCENVLDTRRGSQNTFSAGVSMSRGINVWLVAVSFRGFSGRVVWIFQISLWKGSWLTGYPIRIPNHQFTISWTKKWCLFPLPLKLGDFLKGSSFGGGVGSIKHLS